MPTLFNSRGAAGLELYPELPISRRSLVLALSHGGVEVAYPAVSRCCCELRLVGDDAAVRAAGRDVWLIDDGESGHELLERTLGALRGAGPRRLSLASPILQRGLGEGAVDGSHKIYWADQIQQEWTLYERPVADAAWRLRSAAAARAWDDRWGSDAVDLPAVDRFPRYFTSSDTLPRPISFAAEPPSESPR